MEKKPKVFISYVREDQEKALEIYEFLLQHGCDPWIDVKKIGIGQYWREVIMKNIEDSDYFIACLSKQSITKNGFFQEELETAIEILNQLPDKNNIFCLPIRLDKCHIPDSLNDIQWGDWWEDDTKIQVVKIIKNSHSEKDQKPHIHQELAIPELYYNFIPATVFLKKIKQKAREITIPLSGLPPDAKPLEMVLIPAGSFLMGSPDDVIAERSKENRFDGYERESPQHRVTISQPFYMGKYPITQAQWEAVMGNNPSHFKGTNLPVETVSWNDSQTFIRKLNEMGQGLFRLPSEAEWEYACRAGTTTNFYWGDDPGYSHIKDYAWFKGNSDKKIHEVGLKKPNTWRLYDMSGNVWELCEDEWYDDYTDALPKGEALLSNDDHNTTYRVIRGGCWDFVPWYCLSAYRIMVNPGLRNGIIGFRIVSSRT